MMPITNFEEEKNQYYLADRPRLARIYSNFRLISFSYLEQDSYSTFQSPPSVSQLLGSMCDLFRQSKRWHGPAQGKSSAIDNKQMETVFCILWNAAAFSLMQYHYEHRKMTNYGWLMPYLVPDSVSLLGDQSTGHAGTDYGWRFLPILQESWS